MKTRTSPPTIFLVVVGSALAAIFVSGLVLGRSRSTQFTPGSPEAVAQDFLQAVFDNDVEAAHSLLTPELQDECPASDLGLLNSREPTVAVFDDVRISGDVATVTVELRSVDYLAEGIFPDFDVWGRTASIRLDRSDNEWRVANASHPLMTCPRRY